MSSLLPKGQLQDRVEQEELQRRRKARASIGFEIDNESF